ncbi:MAG: hypothetical protein K2N62_07460 [Desulfovibrio sp.]|nr:hypothetical protein [Desulfovibrio sp.]
MLGPEEGTGASGRSSSGESGPGADDSRWGNAGNPGTGWSSGGASGGRFYRVGGVFSNGGAGFGRVWTATGADGAGCLSPCITLALFLVCLSQFGLLAAIGFVVFHVIGSIAGSLRAMRRLVEGRQPNPWSWRLGNWFISFMLTAWLAGGFNG